MEQQKCKIKSHIKIEKNGEKIQLKSVTDMYVMLKRPNTHLTGVTKVEKMTHKQ